MTKNKYVNQAGINLLAKMYYDLWHKSVMLQGSLFHGRNEAELNIMHQQAVQQRIISIHNLIDVLGAYVLYPSEIEDLAKNTKYLQLPKVHGLPKLTKQGHQKAISLYYEALAAQNSAYHDGVLIPQILAGRLHSFDGFSILSIDKPMINANYNERICGYYIALRNLGVYDQELLKLKRITEDQIWHVSLDKDGSDRYDLHYGLPIPSSVKLTPAYRDLRQMHKQS